MSKNNKVKIFKIILTIMVLILIIGIIAYLFPVMKNLSSLEGQVAFKQKVEDSGILGMLSLFGLQVAQIFLIIVPGEPLAGENLAVGDWKMSIILYAIVFL